MKTLLLLCILSSVLISPKSYSLVFEKDQRADVQNAADPKVLELAKSVFTFIKKQKLKKLTDGSFAFVDQIPLQSAVNLCTDERYASDISVGTRCSGFLASPSIGVTAGHCVSPKLIPEFCANYYIVFDYFKNGAKPIYQLNSDSVRECSKIKAISFSEDGSSDDYAVLEFLAPVLDRKPLMVRHSGKIDDAEDIFMLGYPRGLPQKISEDRKVLRNNEPSIFASNLDCFHGNSGSPVFSKKTHLVEGIFVSGDGYVPNQGTDPNLIGDFYFDSSSACNRTLVCNKYEGCTAVMNAIRMTRIPL